MSHPDKAERRASLRTQLFDRMHDPLQLRIVVIGVVLLVGYIGIYSPLNDRITQTTRKLEQEHKLLSLAESWEKLHTQYATFSKRLHPADAKEWVQYMHEGIRQFPIKMSKLDSQSTRAVGPYRAMVIQVEVQGAFFDLEQFLAWIESNPRLFRADDINIAPAKSKVPTQDLTMKLTLLGMAE